MQVSRREAARALVELRRSRRRSSRRRGRGAWGRRAPRRQRPRRGVAPTTVDAAARLLDERNWVSLERIEAARARMEAGEEPSSDVVAEMIVRRAICDRLR